MPLTDENRGTNANGSSSEDYCVYCYKKGEFTQDFTMSQMIEFCLQFLDQWAVQTECKLSPVQAKEHCVRCGDDISDHESAVFVFEFYHGKRSGSLRRRYIPVCAGLHRAESLGENET